MAQPYVGQILAVGFNFAPVGWALCDGSLLPISQYDALFNLIGTQFGGDGQNTFGLPDLRGRAALGTGQGPGLSNYTLGQIAGSETITLTSNEVGAHTHPLMAAADATTSTPGPSVVLGAPAAAAPIYAASGTGTTLSPSAVAPNSAGAAPHENRQPSTTINYIIALFGIYPSQN